jgi:hypothetical protein
MTARPPADALEREVRDFVARCREPVLLEPGEDPIPLSGGSFELAYAADRLQLHAWSEARNLARRITGVRARGRGKLELTVARFGGREGSLTLADLAAPENHAVLVRSERLMQREALGLFLARQFPGWHVAVLTAGRDLARSLPDTHPRALLIKGRQGIAAIAAGTDPDGTLAYGLLWLDHLRRRRPDLTLERLVLLLPRGAEGPTCWRIRHLQGARFEVFAQSPSGYAEPVDLADLGNLATELEPCRRDGAAAPGRVAAAPGSPPVRRPEHWLERQVRANLEAIDADLLPEPVYGQVPAVAAVTRGVMDLVACGRSGRLAVLELKATQDLRLPLQALDYWMRVAWHLARGEFTAHGYFPGRELRRAPPRLFLVAPAVEFHPANETILGFFASGLEVECVGLGLEWQKRLKVVFRRGRK